MVMNGDAMTATGFDAMQKASTGSTESCVASSMRWSSILVMALLAFSVVSTAHAHQTKLSSTRLLIAGEQISAEIELNGLDLNVATGATLTTKDGAVDESQLAAQLDAVQRYVAGHVSLGFENGRQCSRGQALATPKNDHVILAESWQCPADSGSLVYRVTLFHDIDPVSRHMVSVDGDRKFIGLLGISTPQMAVSQVVPTMWQTFQRYVASGIEHIAIGYDHIAFLIAVIVLGRRFWPLFKVVTAFTIAHSITLTVAVLEIVTLPSMLVEILIAASIVYVAAENFFVNDIRHRWRLTFAFGLIHGFGFASVLRDYGLPQDAIGLALAAFNIGVEIGQLTIVLAAIGIWHGALRLAAINGLETTERRTRQASLVISGAVLTGGLYWLGERLLQI